MKALNITRYALSTGTAIALLAGCSGSQPPIGALGTLPHSDGAATRAASGRSLIAPDDAGRDLLYAATGGGVNVYSYPRGTLLGSLGVGGGDLCSDKTGNVFIPQYFVADVLVYAHGATSPKAVLNDPYFAMDCSVDPTSETVAVTAGFGDQIVIFPYNPRRGWRFAKIYTNPNMTSISFCAYDKAGNLFVDGQNGSGGFMLAELPKDSRVFNTISLDQSIVTGGAMQWIGQYLTIVDMGQGYPQPAVIYRFSISGSSGTKVSSTTLNKSYANAQFWIQGATVIGPVAYSSVRGIGFWQFPAGGSPFKVFSDTVPGGETVSLK